MSPEFSKACEKKRPPRVALATLLTSIVAISGATVTLYVSATEGSDYIEHQMSAEELSRSGVSKLSDDERQFLNYWLSARYTQKHDESGQSSRNNSHMPAPENHTIENEIALRVAERLATNRIAEEQRARDKRFEATIISDFSGWTGKTIFRLDNGEIWRQRASAKYRHRGTDSRVSLSQNWSGGWEMTVLSTGKKVLVKKLR